MTIRHATLEDAPAIAHVQVASWRDAYRGVVSDAFLDNFSEQQRATRWREILAAPEQFTFVAESQPGEVVGFANGGPERGVRADFDGEVHGLYLLAAFRGRGIGRRLLLHAAAELLRRGMHKMLIWTLEANPYRRFYERQGGRFVARSTIEIGDQRLPEVAYGWHDLRAFVSGDT